MNIKHETNDNNENLLQNFVTDSNADELNLHIPDADILSSINNLNLNRSKSEDGICLDMYKYVSGEILPSESALFNEILDTGNFPDGWCLSIISPIHKKGSVSDPNNFRGISLIDSLGKIFSNILCMRLTK